MFDYETLRLIAWLAIGFLIIAFIIIDSHDMGVGILLPFLGKADDERHIIINYIASHWSGTQVLLVSSIATIFVIWPTVYAIAFPELYWAALILSVALLLRPIAFNYRTQITTSKWRKCWDWGIFLGSATPSILIGIAFGNLLLGIPFRLDGTMQATYKGDFFKLLHPFALYCGIISLGLVILQGTSILAYKSLGQLQRYAIKAGRIIGILMLIFLSIAGFWVCSLKGIVIDVMPGYNGIMTTLMKTAYSEQGAWLNNYRQLPILWLIPALTYVMIILTLYLQSIKNTAWAFVASSATIATTILTAIIILFPFVLPSSIDPAMSITLWDGSTSYYILVLILIIALIFIPTIFTYAARSYGMYSKLNGKYSHTNNKNLY